jgi:hypothetical protein
MGKQKNVKKYSAAQIVKRRRGIWTPATIGTLQKNNFIKHRVK